MKNMPTRKGIPFINLLYASCAFWSILAVCILMLFPGCRNVLQSQDPLDADTGTVLLAIDRLDTQRTILPEIMPDRFATFDLGFVPSAGCGAGNSSFYKQDWLPGDSIDLFAGTWDLTVTGFTHCVTSDGYLEAARGKLSGFAVIGGETVTYNVTLYPIAEGGQGTFSWRLDFPSSIVFARMEILTMPGGLPSDYGPFYFHGGPSGDSTVGLESHIAMAAGQYRVLFTMSLYNDQGEMETATLGTILRVYMNMESRFEQAFSYRHFPFSLNRILAIWDGVSWDFAHEGIAAAHFSRLGIRGVDDDNLVAVEYWFNRLIPPGPAPSNLEGLEALVDAALIGMAGASIGAAPHANRLAAQAAILARIANTDPDKVGFSWRPDGTAVSVDIGAYAVEIVFDGTIETPRERGTVFVTIGEQDWARAIMPDIGLDDFVRFDLEFFSVCGLDHETYRISWMGPSGYVELYAGIWDLRVTSYLDAMGEYLAAAVGSLDGIQVLAGESPLAVIILSPIADQGQGMFSWDISFPANVVSVLMDIDSPMYSRHFSNSENATRWESRIDLDAGSYRIALRLTNDQDQVAWLTNALHIFGNMVSHFEFTVTPDMFVTVDLGDPLVTVEPQVGNLYRGDVESYATFAVRAYYIPTTINHVDFADVGVVNNLPIGVTASGILTRTGSVLTGTLTLWSSATAVAGETGNVTVTVNGIESVDFMVTVLSPPGLPLGNLITFRGITQPAWAAIPISEGPFEAVGPLYGTNGPDAEWIIDEDSGYLTLQQSGRTENWHGIYIIPGADGLNLLANDILTIMGRVERLSADWSRVDLHGTPAVTGELPTAEGEHPFVLIWIVGEMPSGNIRVEVNSGYDPTFSPTLIIDSITVERFDLETVFELEEVAPAAAGPFEYVGPLNAIGGEVSWVARNGGMSIRQTNRAYNWNRIDIYIGAASPGLNLQVGDMITITGQVYAENVGFGGWRRMEIMYIEEWYALAMYDINDATGMTDFTLEWIVAPVNDAIPYVIGIGTNGGGLPVAGLNTFYIDSIVIRRPTLATP